MPSFRCPDQLTEKAPLPSYLNSGIQRYSHLKVPVTSDSTGLYFFNPKHNRKENWWEKGLKTEYTGYLPQSCLLCLSDRKSDCTPHRKK